MVYKFVVCIFMQFIYNEFMNIGTSILYAFFTIVFLIGIGLILELLDKALTRFISRLIGGSAAFIACNYLTYIGTVHHELAHALVATLTGAKVTKITLVPKGGTLGSVNFRTRGPKFLKGLQLCLASTAPVYLGLASLTLGSIFIYPLCGGVLLKIIFFYIALSIFLHMTLSWKDIENAFRGLPFLFILLVVIYCISGSALLRALENLGIYLPIAF